MTRVAKPLRWPSELLNWYADQADETDTAFTTLVIGVLAAHRAAVEHRAAVAAALAANPAATAIGNATDAQLAATLRTIADDRSHRELTADDAALIIAIETVADRLDRLADRGSRLHVDVAIVSEQTHRALAPEVCRRLRAIADQVETATGRTEIRVDWPDIDGWVHDPGQAMRSGVIQ